MAWYHRLLNVVRPDRVSGDLEREIAAHLAERTDDLVAAGMSEREATEAARRRFGNRTIHKERARDADGMVWLESLLADFRYAVRALRASPGYTIVAILSLGLGIGANTAVFSLTNALALKSLPVSHPEELMLVNQGGTGAATLTNPLWEQLRDLRGVFSGALAYSSEEFNLSNGGVVRRANGSYVSGSYFGVLGVHSLAGRLIGPGDDVRGCPATAVISAGFAEREFGGAPAAIGRSLPLEGQPFQIVGVVASGFDGLDVGRANDVYAPLCTQVMTEHNPKVLDERSRWYLQVMARPAAGLSIAQLKGRLAAAARGVYAATLPAGWSADNQRQYLQGKLGAVPAPGGASDLRDTYQRALVIVMVLVGVVLLIACANIANLLLARAAVRQREIAIRLAIGAGRWRLVRQLLTESLLLSLVGGVFGIIFARWASRLLMGFLSTGREPVWLDLGLDWRILGFTLGIATVTGVLFGLAPAWKAARVDPQSAMKSGGRGIAGADRRHRIGKALVVGQVALSLVLVAAAGLLVGSFQRLVTLDPGFRRAGVLLVSMDLGGSGLKGRQLVIVPTEMLRQIRAVPGVTSASMSMVTPVGRAGWNDFVRAQGFHPTSFQDSLAYFNHVSEGYFSTLGTELLAGRDITADDVAQSRSVAVIDQAMARRVFGMDRPIGRTFQTPVGDSASPPREVIGVVRDAKYQRLDEKPKATAFFPYGVGTQAGNWVNFEVRTAQTASVVHQIERIAFGQNPAIALEFTTLSIQVSESLSRPRVLAALSGFFGALALLLAVIGLYGTLSYSVTQRRNEIGIRMALGAGRRRVLGEVIGEAVRLVAIGVAVGAILALVSTRLIASFLYGVAPKDPATLAISAGVLAAIAMAAAAAPAWRAARLDPMTALRED